MFDREAGIFKQGASMRKQEASMYRTRRAAHA